jgi:hypothetical protein
MISGNAMKGIGAMGQLKAALHRLADLPMKLAAEAKPGIDRLLREQFTNGTDPYGNAWEPVRPVTLLRRKVKKTPPPLTDTGTLSKGTVVETFAGRRGLRLVSGAPYGYFHQVGFMRGNAKVPARKIFPEHGLPASWRIVLRESASRLARRAVRRG